MSATIRDGLVGLTRYFRDGGLDTPGTDARLLLAHVLKVEPGRLIVMAGDPLSKRQLDEAFALAARRREGRPLSHILGYRNFFAHRFKVTPQVLDPRPETEILIETALDLDFTRVLDLGTGSGAILISLLAARPAATGVGSDLSPEVLALAQENAERIGVAGRCAFVLSDWLERIEGMFDLIVSNPPYIAADEMDGLAPELAHEPRLALSDEGDGLGAYRAILATAPAHLMPGGRLIVEIGPTQGRAVAAMARDAGLENVTVLPDLDGRDRVVRGDMPQKNG